MKKVNMKYGLIALAGLGMSINVNAADLTCNDITFSPDAYAAYAGVDKACLEIVERGGREFAKMEARVVSQTPQGTHLRFLNSDGTRGPMHRSNMPRTFEVVLAGQAIEMRDLAVRQDINVYVGSEFWVSNLEIEEEIVAAVVAEEIIEEVIEEEVYEEMEAELPTTAGPLPWLALFGSLFLILGGALRFSRKQS